MSETWTITELAEHAAGVLRAAPAPGATGAQEAARQLNGRVREVPGERLIRWYTTIGLVDPPLTRRGRIALYGRRHLLQLVAIKRLQASGRSIADIQAELSGATDAHLAHVAGLPAATDPAPTPPTRRDRFWTSPHPVDTHTAADIRTGGDVRQGADVRAATDTWDNISGTGRPHATRGAGEHPASLGHRDGEERPAPAQDHAGNARDLDGHGHTEPARPGGRTGTGPADLGGTGRLHAAREPGEHPAPPGHRDSEERPAPARDSSGAPRAGERTTPAGDRDGEGRLFAGGRRGGGEWAVPGGGRSGEERPIGPLPPLGGTPPIAPLPTVVPRRERGAVPQDPGQPYPVPPYPAPPAPEPAPVPGGPEPDLPGAPQPPVSAVPMSGVRIWPGVTVLLEGAGRPLSSDDLAAIAEAASPLLDVLRRRGLIAPAAIAPRRGGPAPGTGIGGGSGDDDDETGARRPL